MGSPSKNTKKLLDMNYFSYLCSVLKEIVKHNYIIMKKNLLFLLISLLFFGTIHAQNHFTPDGVIGTYQLNVVGEVLIDNVAQNSSDIEVGLFIEEDCKASARIVYYFSQFYRVFLSCSHDTQGATVTFKLYDHSTGEEMDNCEFSFETVGASNTQGSYSQPKSLNFVTSVAPQTCQIDLSVNPADAGTVSGGGTVNVGSTVTVVATANEGYTFVNWTEDGTEVSTYASYSFTAEEDRTLVANFEEATSQPEYPWEIEHNPAFNTPVTFIGQLQINGVTVEDPEGWDLGAFCGDNYRTSELDWYYDEDYQIFIMTIQGVNGDKITFKLYNTTEGAYFPGECEYEYTFNLNENYGIVGDFDDPQPVNFVSEQCVTLDIIGYDTNEGGYYLVASPVEEDLNPQAVGMLTEDYDLYWFNQNPQYEVGLEWINYKDPTDGGFLLESGKGYLYASKTDCQLQFCGTPYNGNGELILVKEEGDHAEFSGWNLVGNPFPVDASIDRDCYVMQNNNDGTSEIVLSESNIIPAMNGIFVIAENDGETMTFSKGTTPDGQGKLILNMLQERGNVIDRAMVRLGESRVLPKFQINENSTKIYLPQDGNDFAVVASANEEQLPVNFKASQNGTYTLSVDIENAVFEHLTLIDHQTGAQVNLLSTPNYQFNANVNDPESRFTISFKSNTSVGSEETFNPICYRQNGQLVIVNFEGEGTLQMVDMLGRILSSNKIKGEYATEINMVAGVYTIRLITNNKTYTQKIVVE